MKTKINKDNFIIKELCFKETSYGCPEYSFNYFTNGKEYFYSHIDWHKDIMGDILPINYIKDFNEKIYDIIKNWKRNYKPDYMIFDSIDWKLEVFLQDGTKYRFKGYHEMPDNFEKLEDYLQKIYDLNVQNKK